MAALSLLAVALAWGTVELESGYWSRIDGNSNDPIVLPLARELASNTAVDDLVAVVGLDWSPAVLYYAHRRGHMVTHHATDVALDLIHRDGYRHLVVSDPALDDLSFLSRWRSVGALAPHLYELADTPAELPARRSSPPTRTAGLAARLAQAPALRQAPEEILCGRGTRLAAGRRGTWLRLGAAPPEARLVVGDRAPVPVRRAVFVASVASPDGSVVVTCTGVPALTLEGVADASGPS